MDDFKLYEGEATIQLYNGNSGEMLVAQTSRALGARNVDPVEAERSAIEKAIDAASRDAIFKALNKPHPSR